MKKFEYFKSYELSDEIYDGLELLDTFGNEGWEMCGIMTKMKDGKQIYVYIFKREKENE